MTKEIIKLIDERIESNTRRAKDLSNRMTAIEHGGEDRLTIDTLDRWYGKHMAKRIELELLRQEIIEMITKEVEELNAE